MKPGHKGLSRLIYACKYSKQGFISTFKTEAAFRQECYAAIILLPLSFFIANSLVEQLLLIITLLLVLLTEILNSALEAIIDRFNEQHHAFGKAKDAGSAAVSVAIIIAAITWVAILLE